ncbi:hypothetical protein K6V98_02450 [Collinsella sp. AGMB00827]|uniref:Uncharacterized protein n=1 Tax=Collinsella ureilytica TaxID=2869515 RepID=A0ABS7MJG1_9ACTN|nr:hypothetical protein [Collinsella urealyticum]MBY4797226.1 hypothetical protein [Collinsella urealyticum]
MSGRVRVWLPPAAALTCACAILVWLHPGTGDDIPSTLEQDVERVQEALDAPARSSSQASFLDDLAQIESRHASEAVPLGWEEAKSLPETAEMLLTSYRDAGGYTLKTSGYLDIHGNIWGALIRAATGSVDLVMVHADEADELSSVRVLRIAFQGVGVQ